MRRFIVLIACTALLTIHAGSEGTPERQVKEFAHTVFLGMTVLEIPCDAELAARASGAGLGVLCARAVLDFERFQYEWDRSLEERVGPFEIVAPLPWVKTSHAHTRTYKIGDVPLAVQFFDQDQIVVLTYPGTKMWEAGQRSVSALIQAASRSEKTARVQEPEGALVQEGPPYLAGVGDVSNPRLIQGSKVAPASANAFSIRAFQEVSTLSSRAGAMRFPRASSSLGRASAIDAWSASTVRPSSTATSSSLRGLHKMLLPSKLPASVTA